MMSRITIHLKRAGSVHLRDNYNNNNYNTTLYSPKTIFFNRERQSTQFYDHPFDTTNLPEEVEEEEEHPRLSADQETQLPPTPPPLLRPPSSRSTINDNDDVEADRISTSGNNHHQHDLRVIQKPLPLVIARQKIHDIQIV
jgi:hypothetical protein